MKKYALRIERPLIFLCGPYFNNKNDDRRKIMHDFIKSYIKSNNYKYYEPIPFIVDPLFNEETIKNRGLNLSLIEEIIAGISIKTYIFLDTLSTAMELGLFLNNNQHNKVDIIIPKEKLVKIGEFIKLSINTRGENTRIIEIKYQTNENNHYFFIGNDLPQPLQTSVLKDIELFKQSSLPNEIIFNNKRSFPNDYLNINYIIYNYEIILYLSLKTLFYLMLSLKKFETIQSITSIEINDNLINDIYEELTRILADIFKSNCSDYSSIIALMNLNEKSIRLKIHNYNGMEIQTIISHMLHLIQIIQFNNKQQVLTLASRRSLIQIFSIKNIYITFFDLFSINEKDKLIMKSFKDNPKKYIDERIIIINNKRRKIISYKNNKYGLSLRRFHEKINKHLEYFKYNENSFAYLKNKSIKKAAECHLQSKIFYKLDIKSFFGSVTKKKLENIVLCLNDENPKACLHNIFDLDFINERNINYFVPKINRKGLREVLDTCFYNNKLPLGFVTSPLLSNIYMIPIDKLMMKQENIIYSRYSDDILISCKNNSQSIYLLSAKDYLENNLKKLSLNLNHSKTRLRIFKYTGDHLKYLGINIVNDNSENRLTISHKFIMKTLLLEKKGFLKNKSKILGRREFIKFISEESYEKYKNIYKIKFNKPLKL